MFNHTLPKWIASSLVAIAAMTVMAVGIAAASMTTGIGRSDWPADHAFESPLPSPSPTVTETVSSRETPEAEETPEATEAPEAEQSEEPTRESDLHSLGPAQEPEATWALEPKHTPEPADKAQVHTPDLAHISGGHPSEPHHAPASTGDHRDRDDEGVHD